MLAKDTAIYFALWNAKLWAAHSGYQHRDAFSDRLFFDCSTGILSVVLSFRGYGHVLR